MGFITRSSFQLSLIFLLMIPMPALAISAITCHCFTDRSYDPARPTVADPYLLATTQNSFFAAAFGVDKKTIVMKKQKGTSADDLWIAYWFAARSGADPEALLQERQTKGSWRLVATPLTIPDRSLGGRVAEALKTNAPDERLAGTVVDQLLLRFRFHGEAELAALRKAGAGNQELVLSGLIAAKTHQPAMQLYRDVKKGATSWGALLQQAKINNSEIQSEVTALVMATNGSRAKKE
ncbi:hypothetical protein [Geotalea toluenoxydans]|uniref:hypothetical protein n=1 Tax=Geotalea toluenoxydans TaxID=421624 RepID=UPI0006D0B838|nr:hypothetical protein [Geotalea toluenoxydans]